MPRDSKAYMIQVFDQCDMPGDFDGEDVTTIIGANGAADNTYHRWTPSSLENPDEWKSEDKYRAAVKFNEWLIDNGMVVDESDRNFYVLIWINW